MLKLISWMVRLTVIAGVLASLQSVAGRRLAKARKAAECGGRDPLPGENGGIPGLPGGGLGLPGFDLASSVLKLLPPPAGPTGQSPTTAPKPGALIRYVGADKGHSAPTAVMELPPGAKAIVVDGRLQIYRPASGPKEKNAARREAARPRSDREATPDVLELGEMKLDLAKLLGQGQ